MMIIDPGTFLQFVHPPTSLQLTC